MDINNLIEILNFSNYFWQIFTPVLFSFMDIISGYIQALINHDVDSSIMRQGLLHKILIILVIIMSCVLDVSFNLSIISKFISIYIILMESTSILENLNKAGLDFGKVTDILKKKGVKNYEIKQR